RRSIGCKSALFEQAGWRCIKRLRLAAQRSAGMGAATSPKPPLAKQPPLRVQPRANRLPVAIGWDRAQQPPPTGEANEHASALRGGWARSRVGQESGGPGGGFDLAAAFAGTIKMLQPNAIRPAGAANANGLLVEFCAGEGERLPAQDGLAAAYW